jgi:hypothetical protein
MNTKNIKTTKKLGISAIIIAKNEETKLPECLMSIKWMDEIILVDSGSTDGTLEIAKKYKAKVHEIQRGSYSDWRNKGLTKATSEWIFYIDADERMNEELKKEIVEMIASNQKNFVAYAIPRKNVILGREFKHGGQWPDYQKRLFRRTALLRWSGDLHEQPEIKGKLGHMVSPLTHIKHDNLSDMVTKTNKWSHIEAEHLLKTGHPQMVPWRFIRIMITEGWIRLIRQKGILDGTEGIIYSIYQMWSKFITYGKLWELQLQNTTINNK